MVISETKGVLTGFVCEDGRVDLTAVLYPDNSEYVLEEQLFRFQFNKNFPKDGMKVGDYDRKKIKVTVELLEE